MSHATTHKPDRLRPESVGDPKHAPNHPSQHGPSLTTYLIIFALLMVLLVATVAAAFLPHFGFMNLGIALAIAGLKATLVILFFMHVRESSRLTKVFVAGTFIWVAIMFTFTFTDYLSRHWLPMSRGWDENPTVVTHVSALDGPELAGPTAPEQGIGGAPKAGAGDVPIAPAPVKPDERPAGQ